jgi:hypothetical protein
VAIAEHGGSMTKFPKASKSPNFWRVRVVMHPLSNDLLDVLGENPYDQNAMKEALS